MSCKKFYSDHFLRISIYFACDFSFALKKVTHEYKIYTNIQYLAYSIVHSSSDIYLAKLLNYNFVIISNFLIRYTSTEKCVPTNTLAIQAKFTEASS